MRKALVLVVCAIGITGKITAKDVEDPNESLGDDLEDSSEHLGAVITQVYQHPYAASLLLNNSYVCSAVILNNHWVLTLSKCFDQNGSYPISSYITRKNLDEFSIRAGSSYNNKGGAIYKVKMLTNNFDLHVSAVKLESPIEYNSQVQAVRLANSNEEAALGYLASMIAWTPNNHMRMVNAPVIDPSICEKNTNLFPGHYICLGGVQDPKRHFCRRDNGGAVIQNDTLVAISSFINTCALYTKTHAFPKVASFSDWLDSVIWDENNRPTSAQVSTTTTKTTTKPQSNVTEASSSSSIFAEPNIYWLTLPFDPINVPLEPAEDNSVLPGMSLYESYLQNFAKSRIHQVNASKVTTNQPKVEPRKFQLPKKKSIRYNFDYN